ncbi:helix-turn-helix transcriptional regulator, partial [Burkholderia cenocepacia]|uniref:helix-turn-helix transcriptional regulator n=1 Tax=Burkholderia cenocepacia TaxID=95486 RepID=UPI000981F49E
MTLDEIPPVLSVKQFCSIIAKSKSWIYEEWKREGSDLPKPFKIGSADLPPANRASWSLVKF